MAGWQRVRVDYRTDQYRWFALGYTTLGQAAATILGMAFGPLAIFLQEDFQISRAQVGLISTAVALMAAPSALFGGRAADRVGERRILIVSSLATALAAVAVASSASFWWLLASCLLLGFGNGMQNPTGSAAIMRWFPQRQRGLAMGIRQTGVPDAVPLRGLLPQTGVLAVSWPPASLRCWRCHMAGEQPMRVVACCRQSARS